MRNSVAHILWVAYPYGSRLFGCKEGEDEDTSNIPATHCVVSHSFSFSIQVDALSCTKPSIWV